MQKRIEECKKRVAAWDAGDIIPTVEMGGISPGYEQCIQVGAIELLRKILASPPKASIMVAADFAPLNRYLDDRLHEVCKEWDLGLSGAQAGAIKHLAYGCFKNGPESYIGMHPEDRRIQTSNHWPGRKIA